MYGSTTDRALERLEQDRALLMSQQNSLTRDLQTLMTSRQADQQKIENVFAVKMKSLQSEKEKDLRRLQEAGDRAANELTRKLETIKQRLTLATQNIDQRSREVAREQQKKSAPPAASPNSGRIGGIGLRR